jgi:5'-3' exonuclease
VATDWLLIDGSSLIFRAYHGVPQSVRAPDGRVVNAVRGFLETLTRLLTTRRPRHLAVAADTDWRPAWRVELIPGYKAHRVAEPIPPGLIPQMPIIEELLAAVGVDFVGSPGFEAEDVIATWTANIAQTVEIVSGDRDLFALIEDPRVRVLFPDKSGLALVDEGEVTRRYGIPGRRYADFAILRGDPSDGLPGLRGVGPAAAAQLIRRHGGVAEMLDETSLAEHDREYLARALRVVPPARDVPVALPRGRRQKYPADAERAVALASTHGVTATCNRLVSALQDVLSSRGRHGEPVSNVEEKPG